MTRTEILATAKPILFNGEMVKAILDGHKTVTRRVIKMPESFSFLMGEETKDGKKLISVDSDLCPGCYKYIYARYQPGDLLYVRETFFRKACTPDCAGREDKNECPFNRVGDSCYGYKTQYIDSTGDMKWRPSIHMPKEAARIFLRVTGVRAERLQDITEDEALKKGVLRCEEPRDVFSKAIEAQRFQDLWDSTIKPADFDQYGWDANPWVWVYEFERVEVQP